MKDREFDYVIVGSGTGGATLANELALRGKDVLVVESGKRETSVGTFNDCVRYYDANKLTMIPKRSREGTILWRSLMVGGSSEVACGNGVRCLEKELEERGIYLEEEMKQSESYIHSAPIDDGLLSDGSKRISSAAHESGYTFIPMPKYIDAQKCHACHSCSLGCRYQARWSASQTMDEAVKNGANLETSIHINRVLTQNGKAIGIEGFSSDASLKIKAKKVILAAGGLGTPVILQHSGIEEAGQNLFIDTFTNTYASTREFNLVHEPQMSMVDLEFHNSDGFLLSPYINLPRQVRFIEAGVKGSLMNASRMLGIMVKTRDDAAGRVFPDGSVSKPITKQDREKLKKGHKIASEILIKAGADLKSIIQTVPAGAHPGGTAAIGTIIDKNLQTKIEGLFVCDASALPTAPGLPPILVIMSLARYLAKII